MKKVTLKHIVWKEGKFYVAQCLNVDVSSFGATRKAAILALQEALELYFDKGIPAKLPEVKSPLVGEMRFAHA